MQVFESCYRHGITRLHDNNTLYILQHFILLWYSNFVYSHLGFMARTHDLLLSHYSALCYYNERSVRIIFILFYNELIFIKCSCLCDKTKKQESRILFVSEKKLLYNVHISSTFHPFLNVQSINSMHYFHSLSNRQT